VREREWVRIVKGLYTRPTMLDLAALTQSVRAGAAGECERRYRDLATLFHT